MAIGRQTNQTPPPSRFDASAEDDGSVMSGAAFGAVVVLGFLLLLFVAVRFGVSAVESDIEYRASGLLLANGLTDVSVVATGTDVELNGTLNEGYAQETVFTAVGELEGVSSVTGSLWYVTGTELEDIVLVGDPIEFAWEGDSVAITGEISNEDRKVFINDTLALTFSAVDDEALAILEGIEDEKDWIGSVLSLLISTREAVEVGRLIVFPSDRLLVVAGEVPDKAVRNELNTRITDLGATLGFDVNPAIRVPETGPTEQEVEALQVEIDEVILDQVVEFETGSDVIAASGLVLLDEMLQILGETPSIRVEIAGHADSQGSPTANMLLSQKRTEAVFAYFITNGESPDRFDLLWFGETVPIADNTTEEGRQRNRRIEFKALLGESP